MFVSDWIDSWNLEQAACQNQGNPFLLVCDKRDTVLYSGPVLKTPSCLLGLEIIIGNRITSSSIPERNGGTQLTVDLALWSPEQPVILDGGDQKDWERYLNGSEPSYRIPPAEGKPLSPICEAFYYKDILTVLRAVPDPVTIVRYELMDYAGRNLGTFAPWELKPCPAR